MSKYQLTFTLRQHTPIIHFQADQEGATLRATEVKPKLDRFLIKYAFGGILNFKAYKDFLIGDARAIEKRLHEIENDNRKSEEEKRRAKLKFLKEQKLALNYKMRIEKIAENEKRGQVVIIPPERDHWILSRGVRVTITTFNKRLLSELRDDNGNPSKLLIDFFNITNFGKRTSKGFGAFYIENDIKRFEESLKLYYNGKIYVNDKMIYVAPYKNSNPVSFYEKIHREWMRLKSGKNFKGYEKSRVFEYLCQNNLRWEKRWIKQQLNRLGLPQPLIGKRPPIDCSDNSWEDHEQYEYRFGRALLGLPEHYEFRANNQYIYQVRVISDEVERFKAPVTFKVFDKRIYAITEDIELSMFGHTFSFKVQKKINNQPEGQPISIRQTLKTPESGEFDLIEFLDSYIGDIGFQKVQ